jgi:hypothetical protein
MTEENNVEEVRIGGTLEEEPGKGRQSNDRDRKPGTTTPASGIIIITT